MDSGLDNWTLAEGPRLKNIIQQGKQLKHDKTVQSQVQVMTKTLEETGVNRKQDRYYYRGQRS